MRDRELYQTILGLPAPWFVERVELSASQEEVQVFVELPAGSSCACPECGAACPHYDHRERRWRHLDTCQYRTILVAKVPRVTCTAHGVLQIKVPWSDPRSQFTALFEALVIDWLLESSQSGVAQQFGITWDEVHGIMDRAVDRGLLRRTVEEIPYLGVDEKSFQRHHEYVSILTDIAGKRVIDVADGHGYESLGVMLAKLTDKQKNSVRAVAMDIWDPYIKAVVEHIPLAASKIVFDKFHVVRALNDAVDRVRKKEAKELAVQGDDRLKGTKYDWMRNPDDMTGERLARFAELKKANLKVGKAWSMKEMAKSIWGYAKNGWAKKFFEKWHAWVSRSDLKPMKDVANMIRRRLDNILTYLEHPITNAFAEGINAKIQWIKQTARGFGNRDNFRRAILFHCGGLDMRPATHTKA